MSRIRRYGALDGGDIYVVEPDDMPIELASDDDEAMEETEDCE